jgi:alpha-L-rhamnosidase
MYGSVIKWFFNSLAGITPDKRENEIAHYNIKPTICGDLKYVKAKYNSIHGEIVSEWNIEKGIAEYHIEIPANTTSTVYLPCKEAEMIMESGIKINDNSSLLSVKTSDDMTAIEIGSGKYHFLVNTANKNVEF